MSKILKRLLVGLIIFMMVGIVMLPVINKSMATELDLSTIMDEEENQNTEGQNENTGSQNENATANGKDNKGNTQNENLNDLVEGNTNTENKNTNTSSQNEIPQTGITEDITVLFFIGVCAVLAIFAYKKVGDYKIR